MNTVISTPSLPNTRTMHDAWMALPWNEGKNYRDFRDFILTPSLALDVFLNEYTQENYTDGNFIGKSAIIRRTNR